MVASVSWNLLPFTPRPDFNQLFASLLRSRADSTAKGLYVSEIKKKFGVVYDKTNCTKVVVHSPSCTTF